ncbi:MAG: (deoxy)nucleoside triphosphate pyrophosphohydrolase [Sphingomonadales bacterium]|nr:MAG: (deoxy)nucleoside triphosphate pyrophosphohydrolase [Sphingomonadales bacterium]
MTHRWITVVAGALQRDDGLWLMHRRPVGKHHAGLWEFPGGKVEPYEMPAESLVRELAEELGIRCNSDACIPVGFAESGPFENSLALVILLYNVRAWEGEPQPLEGGAVDWFTPAQALALPKPPLDIVLAAQLFQNR